MISFMTEVVGIRDDIFLGEGDRFMTEVAASREESAQQNVNAHRPVVLNLQSDLDHPTQSLADLLTSRQLWRQNWLETRMKQGGAVSQLTVF